MKKIFLFILVFTISAASNQIFAQKVLREGYIIKNDGTVVHGSIQSNIKAKKPSECIFKWFDIAVSKRFKPGEIKAFGFNNGNMYASKVIKGEKRFISCIVSGKVSLYYDGKTMYLETEESDLIPLSEKSVEFMFSGKTSEAKNYKEVLGKVLSGNSSFIIPENLELKQSYISALIENYDKYYPTSRVYKELSKDEVYSEMANDGKLKLRYGLAGGVSVTKYDVKRRLYAGSKFIPEIKSAEVIPVAGFFAERQLSKVKDDFTLRGEILLSRTNIYLFCSENDYVSTTRSDINIDFTEIKLPVYVHYTFGKGIIAPCIFGGISGSLLVQSNYSRKGETERRDHEVRQFEDNSLSIVRFCEGIFAGAELRYKINPKNNVFLQGRYSYGSGIYSGKKEFFQSTKTINIIAGFNF